MSFGIGLGAFVDGFQRGGELGMKFRGARKKRQQEKDLRQIATDAKNKFGDVLSDDSYDYMMRRQQQLYLKNGDVQKAEGFRKWSQQETSRKGTKLFASIGAALNSGDYETAAQLGNELSQLDGYGPAGDYEFQFTQHPEQGPGFFVKSPNGQAFVPQGSALPFFTRHFNPEAAAAWSAQQSSDSKALEKEAQSIRAAAIKSLEDQYDGGLAGDDLKFKDMDRAERERMINEYALERIAPGRRDKFSQFFGGSAASGREGAQGAQGAPGVIVDQNTGERVDAPSAQAQEAAPGADGSIVSRDLPPLAGDPGGVPAPSAGPGATTQAISPGAEANAPGLAQNNDVMGAVRAAEQEMESSGNAERAAAKLKAAGVPERAWPSSIRRGLRQQEPAGVSAGPSTRPSRRGGGQQPAGVAMPRAKPRPS